MTKLDKIFELMKKLDALSVESSRLGWVQYTTGYDFGVVENDKKINDFLMNKDHFELVKSHYSMDLDEKDRRRMDLVFKMFEPYHKSDEINALNEKIQEKVNELSMILNTFRFKLDGKEVTSVELSQILNNDNDREKRKKAYLARNQINKPMVDAGFLDLIEMRKEMAKLNGFNSFVELKLYEEDLTPDIFKSWKDEVNEMLPKMNEKRKYYAQKFLKDDQLHPWDAAYVSNKIAPSLSKQVNMLEYYKHLSDLFMKFGFNLDEYNITYDVFSRQNKSEWGYNFPIETAKDSRILANVKDRFYEYGVLLHETGHGVHSFLQSPDEPILNMGINGIVTEGIANLFGSLMLNETFYSTFFDTDLETAREEFKEIKEWEKLNALRSVSRILFDQAFYTTENKNLEDIYEMYWNNEKEILGTEKGDYEPPWAFLIHHTTHPIYLHNYFMGDVTCEMLAEVFNKAHGTKSITDKPLAFGKFLYEKVIQPSGLYDYKTLFEKISGEPFSLKYIK
ncbi:MAG: peptidase M3A and M3B thimet/oligopeptidase F [Clostridia bacterium]|nr:peptidase M3A and M3B thimet/oligopeptidase F [Clostridia bacterium]